jgi:hypothetical protein
MAFPTSPTNGQTATVGGITYTYSSATNSWTRAQSNSIFTVVMDTFTGDGSSTSFYLSVIPAGKEFVTVNIDGVLQLKSAFDLNANTLTFTGTPAAGAVIEVKSIANSGLTVLSGLTYDTFTGDGTTKTYTLNTAPTNRNFTIVTVGGIVQAKTNYTTLSNTITFSTAPPNTAPIEVTTLGPAATSATNSATIGKTVAMNLVFGG